MKIFFKSEWAKLKEMNFTDKRQYIWEYYKLHLLFLAIALYVLYSLLDVWVFNPNREHYLYIAWLGQRVPAHHFELLSDSLEEIVYDPNRQVVMVSSYSPSDHPEENMAIQVRFVAMMQLGDFDAFLLHEQGVREAASEGFIRPVNSFFSHLSRYAPPLYQELSGRLLYITYTTWEEESLPVTDAMAFSMANVPLLEYVGLNTSDLYLSIVLSTEKYYELTQALEVFFR